MSEHTKGKLAQHGFSIHREGYGPAIAEVFDTMDARRLVAAWNACEGISTENLETNVPIKELARRYNAALAQRDDLLAAAKDVLAHRVGDLPVRGWLLDTDASRKDLAALSAAFAKVESRS